MSTELIKIGNRLLTAAMLVALLIACQDMPGSKNYNNGIQIEQPDS